MLRSEEEKVNIAIGEAVLSLLDDFNGISTDTLTDKLRQMLNTETEAARRKIINDAIRQTNGLLGIALSPVNICA